MGYIRAIFLGKEYSIPEDVLVYIDLLDFTENVKTQLFDVFVRKLKAEIKNGNAGLLGDEDLATDIEYQVGRFIAKLCDFGIFNRTVNDYISKNKGYEYLSKVNKAALEKIKSLLMRRLDSLQEGYESAVQRAESHVTGMGFSIWSGSFVNHAIYAAMQASTINKQEKEASAAYQKEINELCTKLESDYDRETSHYINNEYIPNMEAALTVLAYELLDQYVADLIAHNKFDRTALDFVNISRSNDLLKNLALSGNKKAILESAFAACPYNIAVYMQAMKHDLLDYNSFQAAKTFKQDYLILSFFRENWGEASFPTKFNIDYQCIKEWACLTQKSPEDLLRGLTDQYATGIVKEYSRIAEMLADEYLCRKTIGGCSEAAILAGDEICKEKAREYVFTAAPIGVWEQLTERCGHADLLERVKKRFNFISEIESRNELNTYLVEQLYMALESARKTLADQIAEKMRLAKERAEEEARIREEERQCRARRNKKIAAIVTPIITVVLVFAIVLSTVIIPSSKYNKAVSLQESGSYFAAIELYNDLGNYKDSKDRCFELWGKITVRETISAEYRHTVALKTNGTAVAVGDDQYGRTDVSDWTDIIAVSAGINYTLGLKSDGTVVAVGADNDGKCEVDNWNGIVAIAAGTDHSAGLRANGTVVAIGANSNDECEVSDWTNIIAIAVGDSHTVGLKADGTVVATGGTKYGRCDVEDWTDIVAIAAADVYTLGLKSDGTVVAVGTGGYGLTIEYVEDWTDIVAISASDNHILGLKSDGTVVVTGDNDEGQCNVSKWKNIVAIAAGYEHSVGLMADGTVVAAGSNEYGQCDVSKWKDIKLPSNEDSHNGKGESSTNTDYDEYLTWYNVEFASSFLGKELNEDGSLSIGPGDYEAISNDMYLFDIPGRFSHGMSSADADPVIVDILDWVTIKSVDDFDKILNPLIERYGDDYRVQHYNDASGEAYMWKNVEMYEYVICWQNADGTVDIRWTYSVSTESDDESEENTNPKDDTYNDPITNHTPGMFLDYQLGDPILPDHVGEQIITINEVNGHLYSDSIDNATIDSLYWVSANSNGNRQEIVDTAHERIISYFENRYGLGKQVRVSSGVFPHYWGFDDETVTQFITESGLVYLVGPNSEYNIYVVQIEEPYK